MSEPVAVGLGEVDEVAAECRRRGAGLTVARPGVARVAGAAVGRAAVGVGPPAVGPPSVGPPSGRRQSGRRPSGRRRRRAVVGRDPAAARRRSRRRSSGSPTAWPARTRCWTGRRCPPAGPSASSNVATPPCGLVDPAVDRAGVGGGRRDGGLVAAGRRVGFVARLPCGTSTSLRFVVPRLRDLRDRDAVLRVDVELRRVRVLAVRGAAGLELADPLRDVRVDRGGRACRGAVLDCCTAPTAACFGLGSRDLVDVVRALLRRLGGGDRDLRVARPLLGDGVLVGRAVAGLLLDDALADPGGGRGGRRRVDVVVLEDRLDRDAPDEVQCSRRRSARPRRAPSPLRVDDPLIDRRRPGCRRRRRRSG